MRKDIQINVNSETNQVLRNNETLGISSENLQGKIIFKPEPFVDGACRMYIENKGSILMEKGDDCYTLDIKSSLLITPGIDICFKITEAENEDGIPIFCTQKMYFKVLDTIDNSGEPPEDYPTWEEILDSKIAELNELEQSIEAGEEERNRKVDEAVENIEDMTEAYNQNATEKTNEFNTNATNKTTAFDNHVSSKEDEFDTDTDTIVSTKKAELDDYETAKENELDTHANSLKNDLDDYESTKETELNNYTSTKKTELDTYTNTKKTELDTHEESLESALDSEAEDLISAFNTNATEKTNNFNTNATSKTTNFNDNATAKTTDFNDNATEKTTEYDTNATEKVDEYNTNATAKIAEYDSHVAELQTEIDELKETVDSELETATVEGTSIDVSDSAKADGSIGVGGNTYQKQLSGKNKLDSSKIEQITRNGIICSYNSETQEITFNGTCTTNNTLFQFLNTQMQVTKNITRATAYYVRGSVTNSCFLRFFDSNYGAGIISSLLTLPNDKTISKTYNESFFAVNNNVRFDNGSVCNDFTIKIMLVDDTDTTYETYCGGQASPNPDYPQEIKVVTGDNVVKHIGKNLFDKENAKVLKAYIHPSGVITENSISRLTYVEVQPNTTYTISKLSNGFCECAFFDEEPAIGLAGGYGFVNAPFDKRVAYDGVTKAKYTFTTKETTKYFAFRMFRTDVDSNGGGAVANLQAMLDSIQLEQSSTTTGYEEYKSKEFELDLRGKHIFDKDNANIIDGYVNLDTLKLTWGSTQKSLIIEIQPNTKYIIGGLERSSNVGFFTETPTKGSTATRAVQIQINEEYTFTSGENERYIVVMYAGGSNVATYNNFYAIEYNPLELCKIGDYKDVLFKNEQSSEYYNSNLVENAWYKYKNIVKEQITSDKISFNAVSSELNGYLYNVAKQNQYKYIDATSIVLACTHFKGTYTTDWWKRNNIITYGQSGNLVLCSTEHKNVDEMKDFCDRNEVWVYGISLTPIYDQITDETLIAQLEALHKFRTEHGVNHIWTDAEELEPNLEFTYKRSNNLRLQALEQAVVALGGV